MRQTEGNARAAIFSCGNIRRFRGAFAAAELRCASSGAWAAASEGGQTIAAWAGLLPLESADRPRRMHAQGKISAARFFCGDFAAARCQLMLRSETKLHAERQRSAINRSPDERSDIRVPASRAPLHPYNQTAGEIEKSAPPAYTQTMRRDEAIARLKATEPALKAFGVAALYLFGSHARDEAKPCSDIDVFVDVAPGAVFGLLPFMGAFRALEDAFEHQTEIGYSTRDGLSPYIRADVEQQAVRIF
jgi:uncharacterized protein